MNRVNIYRIKSFLSEISDVDVKSGIVTGYFSAFNNIDSDKDKIMPGAFTKTIKERGPSGTDEIRHLLQHDAWSVLGKPQVLVEDKKGLYFETKIVLTSYGQDTLKLYEAGVYNQHSIGYRVIEEKKVLNDQDEIEYWELKEIMLYEGSTVTFAANKETPFLGLKSREKTDVIDYINKKTEYCYKMLKVGSLTDDSVISIKLQLKQLQQLYNELISLKNIEPGISTQRTNEPIDAIKYFKDNFKLIENG